MNKYNKYYIEQYLYCIKDYYSYAKEEDEEKSLLYKKGKKYKFDINSADDEEYYIDDVFISVHLKEPIKTETGTTIGYLFAPEEKIEDDEDRYDGCATLEDYFLTKTDLRKHKIKQVLELDEADKQ